MKLKLHSALKLKNRIAGEIARLQNIVKRENSRRDDSTSQVNVADTLNFIEANVTRLTKLKAAIAKANTGIYEVLAMMEETKSLIAFYQSLDTRDGKETVYVGGPDGYVTYTWKAFLNREAVDEKVRSLQEVVNNLQDAVDTYNASVEIEVDI